MKKFFICLTVIISSCYLSYEIESKKTEILNTSVKTININNDFIPMVIETHNGADIIFTTTGKIKAEKKIDNILEIVQSQEACIIYLKIFLENQAPFTKVDALINIKIPKTYNGSLIVNNYGYDAKCQINNFENLASFTYQARNRADLTIDNLSAISANFSINTVRINGQNINFKSVDINGTTDSRIVLKGQPGNINANSRNYMPIELEYNTFTTEVINITSYSGDAIITIPKNSAFYIEAFSTSGIVTLDGNFDLTSLTENLTNKKFGVINNSNPNQGYIRHNSYLNGLKVIEKN